MPMDDDEEYGLNVRVAKRAFVAMERIRGARTPIPSRTALVREVIDRGIAAITDEGRQRKAKATDAAA